MNWRKPIVNSLLYLTKSEIPTALSKMSAFARLPRGEIDLIQKKKLGDTLQAASLYCPYYSRILHEASVVSSSGEPCLTNWERVPLLTRNLLKEHFEGLSSRRPGKGARTNRSGGSSGEPVRFVQDDRYRDWNFANKIFYKTWCGQQIGEPELRIWGSVQDVLQQQQNMSGRLRNWLYNRCELNAFRSGEVYWEKWAEKWCQIRPGWVEGYVQPLYEFARFLKLKRRTLPRPKGIIASAGTLYPSIKELLHEVFDCPILNRFGAREVGDMGCSCPQGDGLHLSPWNHFIEIVDSQGNVVPAGVSGRVVVTTLNNFTQPLIRYEIGDIGMMEEPGRYCSCGMTSPLLKWVEGRETSVFRTRDGSIVPAEFFIHFIGVAFNTGCIRRFQVVQQAIESILIRVVIEDLQKFSACRPEIEEAIRRVMGPSCRIKWQTVDEIEPLPNGKFLYTVSEVS